MALGAATNGQVLALHTEATTYAFAIDPIGLLRHLHWGQPIREIGQFPVPRLWEVSTNDPVEQITPEEFPAHGGFRFHETCLRVVLANGSRELRLEVVDHRAEGDELVVQLRDPVAGLDLALHYRAIRDLDLIERWAELRNTGAEPFTVEQFASGQVHVPAVNLRFRNVHGHWNAEQQQFVQRVSYGKVVTESRRGVSNHHHNPYFVLDADAGEDHGEVWFGALRYGGNFECVVEQTQYGTTLAQLGMNDWDFGVALQPGQSLTTPVMVIGYTANGLAAMSHRMHEYGRRLMRHQSLRPILYNSWEAAGFDVNAEQQIELARKAAALGVELFVMDDGWFGQRHTHFDGLGDWYVNPEKFPDGLQPLIDEVHALGMKFGIWFEPEAVNPPTRLYAEHPDWIYQVPGRPSQVSREQYLLDLTKPEVEEFVFRCIDDLLQSHRIDYVKWDVNRPIAQAGTDRSLWLRHFEAVYRVADRLHEAHPDLLLEACASGGGRIDLGTLQHFDDFWTSDNTDAYERLEIQRSFSFIYPIKAMRAWVTDVPNFMSQRVIPLRFRFHSAMMGTLGVGLDLNRATDAELAEAAAHVAHYKRIRDVVQEGRFDRLEVRSSNDYHAFQYSLPERSALFVFLPQTKIGFAADPGRIRLRGLDPQSRYELAVEHIGSGWPAVLGPLGDADGGPRVYTGEFLMHQGLTIRMLGDYASAIVEVNRR